MNTTVEIIERARPALKRLQLGLEDGAANPAIGRAVVRLFRHWFHGMPPNKNGFPTTHFWHRAADATKFEATRHSVRISVNQTGVRQRFLGGYIKPVRAKFLTIPVNDESYGHRASDFANLKVVRGPFRIYPNTYYLLALVPRDWKANAGDPGNLSGVYFLLGRGVRQLPDDTVLPPDEEISKTAMRAAKRFFQRLRHTH